MVAKEVEPKKKLLAEAQASLAEVMAELKEAQEKLAGRDGQASKAAGTKLDEAVAKKEDLEDGR